MDLKYISATLPAAFEVWVSRLPRRGTEATVSYKCHKFNRGSSSLTDDRLPSICRPLPRIGSGWKASMIYGGKFRLNGEATRLPRS